MTGTKESDLESDFRFKIGPPLIQTPEDATMAYLRGLISEDELKVALGKFGVLPSLGVFQTPPNLERVDEAFERDLPDFALEDPARAHETLEERQKRVENKEDQREAATKASEGLVSDKNKTVALTAEALADEKNEAAAKAADKVEEKQEKAANK